MPLRPSSWPVRGAFCFGAGAVLLAVGCGGRTSGSGSSSSGSSAGASGVASASGLVGGGGGANATAGGVSGTSATGEPATSGIDQGPSCYVDLAVIICPIGATCQYVPTAVGIDDAYCACSASGETICAGGTDATGMVCVNEQTDPNNCGGCGITCPASAPSCKNGNCVPVADASTDAMGAPEAGTEAGTPPSCAPGGPGMTNCGPGGSGTESCCTSLEVSGGTYYRTYDPVDFNGNVSLAADGGPTGEADPATVSSFRLDKYLVTVGRFQQFVNAWNGGAGWLPPAGSGKHTHLNNGNGLATTGGGYEPGWIVTDDSNVEPTAGNMFLCSPTATTSAGSQENLPLNCVNWYESYAFCIWDGGFLPSDAELEYAAAGGSQQREYAWGSMDPGTASQYAIYNCYYSAGCVGGYSLATIAPVGHASLGAGLWGQLDLAGEVEAWALDSNAPYVNPCNDCAHLGAASSRVVRGGSFIWGSQELLVAFRDTGPPSLRNVVQGFRCARSP